MWHQDSNPYPCSVPFSCHPYIATFSILSTIFFFITCQTVHGDANVLFWMPLFNRGGQGVVCFGSHNTREEGTRLPPPSGQSLVKNLDYNFVVSSPLAKNGEVWWLSECTKSVLIIIFSSPYPRRLAAAKLRQLLSRQNSHGIIMTDIEVCIGVTSLPWDSMGRTDSVFHSHQTPPFFHEGAATPDLNLGYIQMLCYTMCV